MKKKAEKTFLTKARVKTVLLLSMIAIGAFTLFASLNTYEIVTQNDIRFSDVITDTSITVDQSFNDSLLKSSYTNFNVGDFGLPQKIKFPETKQHIDIITGSPAKVGWKANVGLAQIIVTADQRQKVFGESLIYLRYNTPTTRHLGEILNGDVINIVTTDGWQLGYQVNQTTDDPSHINKNIKPSVSRIIVVLVNNNDGAINSFQASLIKVGERT